MSQFILTQQNKLTKRYRKSTLSSQIRIGAFSLILAIILLIGSMSIMFLTRFNAISTKGYMLKQLENERLKIIKKIELSETEIARVRTLSNVISSDKVSKMVSVNQEKIVYVSDESAIAKLTR